MRTELNQVYLIGRLAREPELRYTQKGTAMLNTSVAVDRFQRDLDATESKKEVDFINLTFWSDLAEKATEFRKGQPVLIEGHLHLDRWEDKQSGENRSQLKVIVDNIQPA